MLLMVCIHIGACCDCVCSDVTWQPIETEPLTIVITMTRLLLLLLQWTLAGLVLTTDSAASGKSVCFCRCHIITAVNTCTV